MTPKIFGRAGSILAAYSLSACFGTNLSSELQAWRLPADGALQGPGFQANGIPFQMTRPVFVLKEVTPSDENGNALYELEKIEVPDPNYRFAVNLDPVLLSDFDFKVGFFGTSQLQSLDTTVTDGVVPAVTSIASFALSALGSTAAVAAARPGYRELAGTTSSTQPLTSSRVWLVAQQSLEEFSRETTSEVVGPRGRLLGTKAAERAIGSHLSQRMGRYTNAQAFLDDYAPFPGEGNWLRASRVYLNRAEVRARSEWDTSLVEFQNYVKDRNATAMRGLDGYVKTLLTDSGSAAFGETWLRLGEVLNLALPAQRALERDLIEQGLATPPSAEVTLRNLIAAGRYWLECRNAAIHLATPLFNVADRQLDRGAWRRSFHLELRESIGQLQRNLLQGIGLYRNQQDLDLLRDELGKVRVLSNENLGLLKEYERRTKLQEALAEIPVHWTASPWGVKSSPASEAFTHLRAELDLLDAYLATQTAALIAKPAQPSPPPPKAAAPKRRIDLNPPLEIPYQASDSDRQSAVRARIKEMNLTSEFVIVIEPLTESQAPSSTPK